MQVDSVLSQMLWNKSAIAPRGAAVTQSAMRIRPSGTNVGFTPVAR